MSDSDQTEPLLRDADDASYNSTDTEVTHATFEPRELRAQRKIDDDVIPETATVGRNLSWSSAYIIVISRVIGSGIFAMPGSVLKSVGSIGLSLSLWIVGALIAWCGLMITMEYGTMLPRSGGIKVYLEYTFRRPRFLASVMVAVQAVLLGFTASNCVVFAKYTLFAFSVEPSDVAVKGLAVGVLTAITVVHGCFLRAGIWIQNALGWLKVALIVFMFFTGVFAVALRKNEPGTALTTHSNLWDELWTDSQWSWGVISTAVFKVAYTYAGLENVNNVMNEVKNPVRTLKTVGPVALLTACLLYVLMNIAYFMVVPVQEIKGSGELVAALFCERVFGHDIGRVFLPLAIAICAAANVMVVTFALARVNQEVARQGFLPYSRILASSQPFNTPLGGLIVHWFPSALVIAIPPSSDVYSFIADVEGYAGSFYALAISLGLIWLRKEKPDLNRPFKAWLPAVWLRAILSVALIIGPLIPPKHDGGSDVGFFYATYALVAISVLLFGVVYWYIWTVLIPKLKGTRLEEESDVLNDGTTITRLVHRKQA